MNNQILTIAIPTFNRPTKIQNQVRLLLPQLNNSICLVVYDNFSEMPVHDLFSESELAKFSIVRNKINVGADANIARCFENCLTKWLWTLSDDDFVKGNSVEIVFDEISKSSEAIFINFYRDKHRKAVGFDELCYLLRNEKIYSSSFTMSSCLYDISKLRYSLIDYYENLSSMVGTLILILKYVQRHENSICIFSDKNPINEFNTEVGWNYGNYITRSRIFIDAFGGKNNKTLNKTLFVGCHKTNYNLIIWDRKESNINYFGRWRIYFLAISNQGIINAIRYTPKRLIYTLLCLVFRTTFTIGILKKM